MQRLAQHTVKLEMMEYAHLNTSACPLTSAGFTNEVSEPAGKRQGTSPDRHSQGHMWETKKGVSSAQDSQHSVSSVCGCWDHWETRGSQLSPVITVQIVLKFSYSPELFSLIFHVKIQRTVSWKHLLCNVDYFNPFLLKEHLLWLSLLISSLWVATILKLYKIMCVWTHVCAFVKNVCHLFSGMHVGRAM